MFKEDYGKRFILLLRGILIIIVGSILYFSYPPQGLLTPSVFFIPFYILTNLGLWVCPEGWFHNQKFIFFILLLDVILTTLALFLAIRIDSQFYLVFFLILLIAAASRRAKLLYSAFGLILIVYGFSLYLKAPEKFLETETLLRFPFIFIVTFFFHGMMESYNRVFEEKETLAGDYRELEVLTEVAQSIEEGRNLPKFLLTLTQIMTSKFKLKRCTAVYLDPREESGCMVSSNDSPEKQPLLLDLKKYPTLKESLKKESISGNTEANSPLSENPSRYILKTIPLGFRDNKLGTLYLRANTPQRKLTHREEFFLSSLAQITAMAIFNFGLDRLARQWNQGD
ncbi:MAG: GAF domain-containing protein [Deltaproteobacteria bacterium]|nr:GAF domain-containing protein [Deltaproteobacteria bacterium]